MKEQLLYKAAWNDQRKTGMIDATAIALTWLFIFFIGMVKYE